MALAGVLQDGPASAQEKHVEFTASIAPLHPSVAQNKASANKGEYQRGRLLLTIKGKPADGWHTYPINNLAPGQDEGQRSKILVGKGFVAVGPVKDRAAKREEANGVSHNVLDGRRTWERLVS